MEQLEDISVLKVLAALLASIVFPPLGVLIGILAGISLLFFALFTFFVFREKYIKYLTVWISCIALSAVLLVGCLLCSQIGYLMWGYILN